MKNTLRKSIQQILLAGSTAAFVAGAMAAVGPQMPPPGPGQVPDYFGAVPNYANSPQPVLSTVTITDATGAGASAAATTYDYTNWVYTGGITDIQVVNGGAGYTNPVITVNGGPGFVAATATATLDPVTGAITAITVVTPGSGYTAPIAGTGLHKFMDSLAGLNTANNLGQQLPIAVPDTVTFPGSDYYVIAETEYTQKLHSELQATHLRGYKQLNAPVGSAAATNQYLGPIIVAKRDRPVRIKLVNQLGVGVAGNLPLPVDTTYMGAAQATDTANRTALHLHGGNTPWISDGTPRQTVKPAGEVLPNKGESARDVPDMWFDAAGNLLANSATCTQGTTVCTTPGATNNPGNGALTFFYTNEQSARLMFYHDHAEGLTRLNVYDGMAAGYVLQDPTEQAMVNGGTAQAAALAMGYSAADAAKFDAVTVFPAALPPLADTIPLVIQEKTFVPNDSTPVLNFYGAFKSQLNSQDPTWRWGSKSVDAINGNADSISGTGDLWVPHVFMPNQNPGDISGGNAMGRWDYGPWFWPPFTGIDHGAITNPYFDPTCVSSLTQYCEGPTIPGTPNGNTFTAATLPVGYDATIPTLGSPSGTPEAFNDTPLVNGTVYPKLNVEPKKYRFRLLSVGNDRMLNLSLVMAASKNSKTTAVDNGGAPATAPAVLCDGVTIDPATGVPAAQADCTEVKMLPFDATQNKSTPFPAHWYTVLKAGVTFDGRPSGVFDPASRGPAMVQFGTEGGFLSSPAVIRNQPVNFEFNPKNIVIGNIKEHALLLGPAERADVVVDFSQFAGSTLIMYNDSPAPVPAFDLRVDYYTGNYDNTDTGGAFSTIPGYGPNTRTIMQIQVAATCTSANCGDGVHNRVIGTTRPVDDVDATHLASLTTAVQAAFKTSQEPIIVPQVAYNAAYGLTGAAGTPTAPVTDATSSNLSLISDNWLTYRPLNPTTLTIDPVAQQLFLQPKTIIEDWTRDYGRMNAMLGTEIPNTTAIKANAIPQAYIDPPTELVKITQDGASPITGTLADGTQLWKITHNGVDSHAMHFHLFHVQIINRVGWDGAIRAPSANELGWKDTVLMHPLEDVVVAMRPKTMTKLPFKVPNSHRVLDTSGVLDAAGLPMFFNFDPISGNASNVTNQSMNFGWEYVWHCHILGHEENDMMRAIAVAKTPENPVAVSAAGAAAVTLTWNDNSIVSNWVKIQRSTESTFLNPALITEFNVVEPECAVQTGCGRTFVDTAAPAGTLYYRVMSNNTVGGGNNRADVAPLADGTYGGVLPAVINSAGLPAALTPGFTGYANVTANSDWSGVVSRVPAAATAVVSPAKLAFPNTTVKTASAALTATLTNSGASVLNITSIATAAPFARPAGALGGTCGVTLAAGASCTINVTFTPTTAVLSNGTLTITDNSGGVVGTKQTVALSGTGVALAIAAPTSVAIQRTSATAATLSWVDASTNELSFQVQTSVNAGVTWTNLGAAIARTAAQTAATGGAPLTAAIAVTNTTNALYRVNAINGVNTGSSASVGLNDTVAPVAAVQAKLVATPAAGILGLLFDQVVISWADTPNNNATYNVQYSLTAGGAWTNLVTGLAGNVTSYTWTLVPRGLVNVQVKVQAVNSVRTVDSNIQIITTP